MVKGQVSKMERFKSIMARAKTRIAKIEDDELRTAMEDWWNRLSSQEAPALDEVAEFFSKLHILS